MNKTSFNISDQTEEQVAGCLYYKTIECLKEVPSWDGSFQNEEEVRKIARWMLNGKKNSLILMGGVGCGKTILAKALGRTIAANNFCPYYLSMDKLVKIAKAENEIPDLVYEDRMLILDDVGTEPKELNIYGNRYQLFNEILYARYARRQPTVITTNFNINTLTEFYGERIASRIREMFNVIVFKGKDLRK